MDEWTSGKCGAVVALAALGLACAPSAGPKPAQPTTVVAARASEAQGDLPRDRRHESARTRLVEVLEAQSAQAKARYVYRHPLETLSFFGVEPGMTVVDTLPGRTWYIGILLDYLGAEGRVIPADYSPEMWATFGEQAPDPESRTDWPAKTVRGIGRTRQPHQAEVSAFQFGHVPDELVASADVVLMVRALHHFMRLEASRGYFTEALASVHSVLKPGGVVGVVQHRASESSSEQWADGTAGYVKQSAVVRAFERAGFQFVEAREINANALDVPTEKENVWRLPPERKPEENQAALREKRVAIGESDRMTLKFRKPE